MTGAATRGLLMALLIASPALLLPDVGADSSQITVLVALIAGFLVTTEYNATFPSIVEFRDAPPFNRMRFLALALTVLTLSAVLRDQATMGTFTGAIAALGTLIGEGLDFPFSPVRLIVLTQPETTDPALMRALRSCAGIAYFVSIIMVLAFLAMSRLRYWPGRNTSFNVLVNLPLFDPTAGGDVIERLQRDARVNIALGFLLPFLIPAMVKGAAHLIHPITIADPQTIIWTVSAWAFLPASLIMRGIAMARVAELIHDKRRRTYANALEDDDGFQAA